MGRRGEGGKRRGEEGWEEKKGEEEKGRRREREEEEKEGEGESCLSPPTHVRKVKLIFAFCHLPLFPLPAPGSLLTALPSLCLWHSWPVTHCLK